MSAHPQSPDTDGPSSRAVSALLRLYPADWRERYGDEVAALLADRPLSLRTGLDLVRGAWDAHSNLSDLIGRWSAMTSRLRSTAVTTFTAWVAFCVAAGALSKVVEDPAFTRAAHSHHSLEVSYGLVQGALAVALLAVLVGGLPLAWVALRQAWAHRDTVTGRLLLVPIVATASVVAYVLVATRVAGPTPPPVHSAANIAVFTGLVALGGACTVATVAAIRVAAHRAELPLTLLRLAGWAAVVTAAAISAGVAALAGYGWALRADEPTLFRSANGILATPLPVSVLVILAVGLVAAQTADRAAFRGLQVLRAPLPARPSDGEA